jgi:Putative addiction module component
MAATVDLQQMSVQDKIRLMEALWHDLSVRGSEVVSPAWHGDVLAERERRIESGEESFIEWEIAKKSLREELE